MRTTYVAKIQRTAQKWGGGISVTTSFFSVDVETEDEAKQDTQKVIKNTDIILFICPLSELSADDLQAYNAE